jgi:hypothetical protein
MMIDSILSLCWAILCLLLFLGMFAIVVLGFISLVLTVGPLLGVTLG